MNETILADPAKYFWLKSGRSLRSIRELANIFPSLSQEEYYFHANEQKNDFSNWLATIFNETELAEKLRHCKTKDFFQSTLYNYVTHDELRQRKENREQRLETTEHDIIQNPEAFAKYHEEEAKRKDILADRFDAAARRFVEQRYEETPKEIVGRADALLERYHELRQRIAEARKQGKDPLIADLTLRPVPAKVAYARISGDEKDFQMIGTLLVEAEAELQDALTVQEPDAKRDVARLAAASGGVEGAASRNGGGR